MSEKMWRIPSIAFELRRAMSVPGGGRPRLESVRLEPDGSLVATDGHMLVRLRLPAPEPFPAVSIPGVVFYAAARVCEDLEAYRDDWRTWQLHQLSETEFKLELPGSGFSFVFESAAEFVDWRKTFEDAQKRAERTQFGVTAQVFSKLCEVRWNLASWSSSGAMKVTACGPEEPMRLSWRCNDLVVDAIVMPARVDGKKSAEKKPQELDPTAVDPAHA